MLPLRIFSDAFGRIASCTDGSQVFPVEEFGADAVASVAVLAPVGRCVDLLESFTPHSFLEAAAQRPFSCKASNRQWQRPVNPTASLYHCRLKLFNFEAGRMADGLTKSQLNRIGERLRKNIATEDDIRRLDAYRISFMPAFQKVFDELTAMGLRPGGRPQKTTPSIVAKLNREKTRLSTMQDIAGCRVEVLNRLEQDHSMIQLVMRYPGAEVQDRRTKPSYGYRAVHVIVSVETKPIEIQIRTELQHNWALVTEKLADVIDHQIKYGGDQRMFKNY